MYDYADYLEQLYASEFRSFIIFPDAPRATRGHGLKMFRERFPVFFYNSTSEDIAGGSNLPIRAKEVGCDMLYIIKGGLKAWEPSYPNSFNLTVMPAAVHAVFEYEEHGSTYAAIAPAVAINSRVEKFNVVPHMILPPNITNVGVTVRSRLGIPKKALVLCRIGGSTTFDVDFAKAAIRELVAKYDNSTLQFLFLGTDNFGRDCRNYTSHNFRGAVCERS